MKRKYNKSIFGATAIVVSIAVFIFVIVIVLSFFYFFKFQIGLVIRELYLWNKFQEMPLSLLSMDMDDESFVIRMNKVYYFGTDEEKEEFKNKIDGIVKEQIFPVGVTPATAEIMIAGIAITEEIPCTLIVPGCEIVTGICSSGVCDCHCGDECPLPFAGKYLGSVVGFVATCRRTYDICECVSGDVPKIYSARFPFPLTFDGTKFTDELSYEIIEEG